MRHCDIYIIELYLKSYDTFLILTNQRCLNYINKENLKNQSLGRDSFLPVILFLSRALNFSGIKNFESFFL